MQAQAQKAIRPAQTTSYEFLKGSMSAAEQAGQPLKALSTPLDDARSVVGLTPFSGTTTGTQPLVADQVQSQLELSPAIVSMAEQLRQVVVTKALTDLAVLVAAIQIKFESGTEHPGRIANPSVVAEYRENAPVVEDFSDYMLAESSFEVQYVDSTPTVDGVPIWERLPGERIEFYNLFKLYRDSRYYMLDDGDFVVVNRTMAGLARQLSVPGNLITYIAKLYSWPLRTRLYDEYMTMERQKRQAQRMTLVESDQSKIAKQLCDKAMSYLNANFNNLAPKEVLSALDLGIKLSRINVGLMPDKPGEPGTTQKASPQLAIYNNTTNNTADQMLNVTSQNDTGSPVERQLRQDMKQQDNLLSVLHVLQASGAMNTVVSDGASDAVEPTFEGDEG